MSFRSSSPKRWPRSGRFREERSRRGRRFGVARRTEEIVRQAIVLIGNGRCDASQRDDIHHQVVEGRSLLRSYLDRN